MKRYKRKFDIYNHSIGRFTENVVHVQKYLDILNDELKQIKRDLIFYKSDRLQLFNEKFYTYKIKFFIIDTPKGEFGCVEGKINREDIRIYLNEDFYFYTAKENLDVFQQFQNQLLVLFSHELVHRGQYYIRVGDKINFYNFEGSAIDGEVDIEYLKNHQEIMAYSLMYIESLRYSGFKNEDILQMLKSGNFAASRSLHINFYINEMNKYNRDAYLKFRKYIYQYLVDPVRYELRVI
jgi:hypothetical protein